MRFKQRHPILESLLYKWRSGFIGTYHANTILHTALHLLHHRTLICIRRSRHHVSDNPLCCGDLINFPFPTIVEHPLISPLVTKLFNQLRQKFERRIVRVNRRCGYLSFKAFYNWRRILQSLPIRRYQSGYDGQSRILLVFLCIGSAEKPLMGNIFIPKVGPHLERVRRHFRTKNSIRTRHRSSHRQTCKPGILSSGHLHRT